MIAGGIEHRAAKVSLVNGLSTALTLTFQLISVPICLKYWGKTSYGSWLALLSAFTLLRSLDGGYTAYVGNKLNYLFHRRMDELREHLASAIIGIMIVSAVELLISAGTIRFATLAAMLGMPESRGDVSGPLGLLLLTAAWVLTGSYIGIVHRLQIPSGMMYQAAWWAMVTQVTQFAATMAAAVLSLDMLRTSLLFAFAQIASYIASAIYVRRMLPQFWPWSRGISARVGLRDLIDSLALTGSNIVQQGATSGAVVLVAALAGPVAVPLFTTVRTVANLWTSVSTVLTAPLLPDVVRYHVNGEAGKLLAVTEAFWVLIGSAVALGALLLYPILPFLYDHWTAHTVALNGPFLSLLLASVIVTNSGALMALHLNGINSLRIGLGTSLARAAIALIGGALAYARFGMLGIGAGILAGEIAAVLMTGHHFVKYELKAKGMRVSPAAFGPVALTTVSTVVFFVGAAFDWWAGRFTWLAAITVVAASAAWGWRMLDPTIRIRLRKFLMHLIPLRP